MKYFKDENGKWWYQATINKKISANIYTCKYCSQEFPRAMYNKSTVYCSRTCSNRDNSKKVSEQKMGFKNYKWKGGRKKTKSGYVLVYCFDHPNKDSHHCILEHRLIMEKHIERYLYSYETVHHKNGIKDDNRIENLELFASKHPPGQRVIDLVNWAKEILQIYNNFC